MRINFQAFVYEFGDEENARRYRDKQYEEAKKNWCDKNGIALKRIEEMRKIKQQVEKLLKEEHQIIFEDNRHLNPANETKHAFTELDAIDQYYIIKVNKSLIFFTFFRN